MADQQHASVIKRKTRAARDGADPRVMSPVRALRLALARAADTLFDLPLVVATVEQRRVEAGEVVEALGTEGLFVLLDGAEGARAAMRLDPGVVAALIEVQTTGQIRPGEVRARAPTRTDAAMVAPLVDEMLAGFDQGMGESGAEHAPQGFHFGDRVEDARALSLLLAMPAFEFFRLTVDLGPGLRSGRLDLLLPPAPAAACAPGARSRDGAAHGARAGTAAPDTEELAGVALAAPVVLDAVLARIALPLSDAMALETGQRLAVPVESLRRVRLVAAGGHVAAQGRLGRRDGWRALRLAGMAAEARDAAATGRGGASQPGDAAAEAEAEAQPEPRQKTTPDNAGATADAGRSPETPADGQDEPAARGDAARQDSREAPSAAGATLAGAAG